MTQHSTFPRSHLLILGPNSIQSLLPVTPISQAEALLESHRIEDVIQLADEQRKKVQSRLIVDANEVRLVSSIFIPVSASTVYLGTLCRWMNSRTSTRKSASGACSRRGSRTQASALPGGARPAHPHLVLPDLRGALLDAEPTLDVFSGVAECLPPYDSIDDISTSPVFPTPLAPLPYINDAHPRFSLPANV